MVPMKRGLAITLCMVVALPLALWGVLCTVFVSDSGAPDEPPAPDAALVQELREMLGEENVALR